MDKLRRIFSDTGMIILSVLAVVGIVLIWWTWTFNMLPVTFVISLACSAFILWNTYKYGHQAGLYK